MCEPQLSGRYRIAVIGSDGQIKQVVESKNLITTKGYFNIFCRFATNRLAHRQFMDKIRVYNSEYHTFDLTSEELVYSPSNTSRTDAYLEEYAEINTPEFNVSSVNFKVPFKFQQHFNATIPAGALKITHIAGYDGDKIVSVTELSEPVNKGAGDTLQCTYTLEYVHPWVETMPVSSGNIEVDGVSYPYELYSSNMQDHYTLISNLGAHAINEFIYALEPNVYWTAMDTSKDHRTGDVAITENSAVITCKAEYNVSSGYANYFNDKTFNLNRTSSIKLTGDKIAVANNGSTRISFPGVRWVFGFPAHFNKARFDEYTAAQIQYEEDNPEIPPDGGGWGGDGGGWGGDGGGWGGDGG